MKRSNITIRRGLVLLLALIIVFSSVETAESSKLKRARRAIENSEESESNYGKWSPNRRRLTMADDMFLTTGKEYQIVGYHRAIGATVITIIKKFFGGIGSILKLMRNALGSRAIVPEPEPEPATMMSSIYDSISSAMSSSNSTSVPAKPSGQKPVMKSAPLQRKKNLPKASSRGGALGNKSIMEDLVKNGSSASFDSQDTGVTIAETLQSYLPDTSKLAKLLPTLVAGLVFTTAGTIVGYMWNSEMAATASSYLNYLWGVEGENTSETDSFYDAATSTSSTEGQTDELSSNNFASTTAVPVTPGRF